MLAINEIAKFLAHTKKFQNYWIRNFFLLGFVIWLYFVAKNAELYDKALAVINGFESLIDRLTDPILIDEMRSYKKKLR
jgi:hypothetical protein